MKKKDNLLAKWAANELSDDEKRQFESENDLSDLKDALNLLDRLEYPPYDQEAAWKELNDKLSKKSASIFSISFFMKAASVILLMGALIYYFLGNQDISVVTNFAQTEQIFLPDHSEVVLNHNSVLKYDKDHWSKKRAVHLQGEAYFKVAKGSTFVVKTPNGIIQVVGTQFNIYQRKNILRVSCFEGKVQVFDEISHFQRAITPSESVYLVNHKQVNRIFEELGDKPSWITGRMNVKSKPVSEILSFLSSELQLDFDDSNIDTTIKYSGPVYLNDIKKTMSIMGAALSWDAEYKGNRVVLKKK